MSAWDFSHDKSRRLTAAQLAEFLGYPNIDAFEHDRKEGRIFAPDGVFNKFVYWTQDTAEKMLEARADGIRQAWGYESDGGER